MTTAVHASVRGRSGLVAAVAVLSTVLAFCLLELTARHSGGFAFASDRWVASGMSGHAAVPPVRHVRQPRRLVAAPAAPAGSGGFVLDTVRDGRSVLFDPCVPIRYVVSGTEPFLGATDLLRDAFAQASRASGLRFVDAGVTTEVAAPDRSPYQPLLYGKRWAPVLVAWTDEQTVPRLGGDVIGLGGPLSATVGGDPRLVSGIVYLDAPQLRTFVERSDIAAAAETVMLHEIGHVLGLGHVADADEVMYPDGTTWGRYSDGDLRGLAAAGSGPFFTTR